MGKCIKLYKPITYLASPAPCLHLINCTIRQRRPAASAASTVAPARAVAAAAAAGLRLRQQRCPPSFLLPVTLLSPRLCGSSGLPALLSLPLLPRCRIAVHFLLLVPFRQWCCVGGWPAPHALFNKRSGRKGGACGRTLGGGEQRSEPLSGNPDGACQVSSVNQFFNKV